MVTTQTEQSAVVSFCESNFDRKMSEKVAFYPRFQLPQNHAHLLSACSTLTYELNFIITITIIIIIIIIINSIITLDELHVCECATAEVSHCYGTVLCHRQSCVCAGIEYEIVQMKLYKLHFYLLNSTVYNDINTRKSTKNRN